ncbi:phosphate ABC transporter permease PstA [Pacificispira spongiicola]|uniref:phosphate ABC transporter permease PstA n=1 Tax=Pacificispira spongiicola TaxID=2729598 RepID=UPI0029C9C7F6|nr:phosphate ABC transporter permease PstA [Pacificispira spongiicola]
MTTISEVSTSSAAPSLSPEVARRLKRRYAAERRFQVYGLSAIMIGLAFLVIMFTSIIQAGLPAFQETRIRLDVELEADKFPTDPAELTADGLRLVGWTGMIQKSIRDTLKPEARSDAVLMHKLLSPNAEVAVRDAVVDDPSLIGSTLSIWVLAAGDVDAIMKGTIDRNLPEEQRTVNDKQLTYIDRLDADGRLRKQFAFTLFTAGASSYPESSGIGVAMIGSLFMMLIVLMLALPIGVAAAVYLEEFAPRNRWTDIIEVNINNLAAVPSIVFGLLGLAVFINFVELPRSAPLVGGLVLTLMTLPTVIIATRAALKAVPPSIREAALGIGASKMQSIFHHVLPLAAPGILTSIIIGLAQALGETAPLLMIGMVATVFTYPATPMDPATALPVQIYMWSGLPERGFVARTSAGIMVLLGFLIFMNALAVFLRKKFERRW